MTVRRLAAGAMGVLAMAAAPGCECLSKLIWPPETCPAAETIVPVSQVVAEYNANASRVDQLWAKAKIEVTVPRLGIPLSWGSTRPEAEPNGLLMLFKNDRDRLAPSDFCLIGRDTGIDVFKIGCDTKRGIYYFWFGMGEESTLMWGRIRYAGAPGVKGLPIDPLQVPSVLGICELPGDLSTPPIVAQTMDLTSGRCAYVLTYIDRQPVTNRLLARREVYFDWSETRPRRPFMVKLFDDRGVRVMTAKMTDYARIRLADDEDQATGPDMPTDIRISWHGQGTSVHIVLDRMNDAKGMREGCKPPDQSFKKIIQVDRGVTAPGAGNR